MEAISRVLCAVDIDDSVGSAFEQALAIGESRGATLLLMCAVPVGQGDTRAGDRLAYLSKLRRQAEAAGVDVHASVRSGDSAELILQHASARDVDLIVVGVTHDRAEGRPWGTVAEDVLRSADCPTLTVPVGAPSHPAFATILCAVDLERDHDKCVDNALRLALPRDHKMAILHVAGSGASAGAALEKVQSLMPPAAGSRTLARVTIGRVGDEVLKAARAVDADLLVIGARRRNRVGRKLFGVTGELLTASHCPVLAVPIEPVGVRHRERKAA